MKIVLVCYLLILQCISSSRAGCIIYPVCLLMQSKFEDKSHRVPHTISFTTLSQLWVNQGYMHGGPKLIFRLKFQNILKE